MGAIESSYIFLEDPMVLPKDNYEAIVLYEVTEDEESH